MQGTDVTIIAIGNQVRKALTIGEELKKDNIKAEVINVRFLKPFDNYSVVRSICKTKFVITIEDNTIVGGLSSEVKELIAEKQIKNIKIKSFAYPDVFVEHGSVLELEKKYKVDEKTIYNYIKNEKQKNNKKEVKK